MYRINSNDTVTNDFMDNEEDMILLPYGRLCFFLSHMNWN